MNHMGNMLERRATEGSGREAQEAHVGPMRMTASSSVSAAAVGMTSREVNYRRNTLMLSCSTLHSSARSPTACVGRRIDLNARSRHFVLVLIWT